MELNDWIKSSNMISGAISEFKMPPSLLSKLMICPAYMSQPLSNMDHLRFLAFHAIAVQKVIVRHLRAGFSLIEIEVKANRGRVDLVFRYPDGRRRQVEVKSSKKLYLYAQYQATFYWNRKDELVIANPTQDMLLPTKFIENALRIAKQTEDLITNHPETATKTYKPHEELCRICGNQECHFKTPHK